MLGLNRIPLLMTSVYCKGNETSNYEKRFSKQTFGRIMHRFEQLIIKGAERLITEANRFYILILL